jgi:hypothetical protein
MSNPPYTDSINSLLQDRLNRAITTLRGLSFPTREEYQAAVYSVINQIINNGYGMSKLPLINAYTPAKIGDYEDPLTVLNNDGIDSINELNRVENLLSQYYNSTVASENTLRQVIRDSMNSSSQTRFYEGFINSSHINSNSTGAIDVNAANYSAAISSTTVLSPTIAIGPASVGSIGLGTLSQLSSTNPLTYFSWLGSTLELIFTFPTPTPLNRIYIKQYNYGDLGITNLVSTPDGTYTQDILAELGVSVLLCDITSNKSSGESNIDFSPKSCGTLTMTIKDQTGLGVINLDWVQLIQRKFNSSAVLNSTQIMAPLGAVLFSAESIIEAPYTTISHQVSFDGTSYQGLTPGDSIVIPGSSYWYRGILTTNTSLISSSGASLTSISSISPSTNYSLSSMNSTALGNNLVEKTLVFNNINGPILILDPIILDTLYVQQGASILSSSHYTLSSGTLTLDSTYSNVTIAYQTNASSNSITSLLNYFSPILVSYLFEEI